MSWSELAWCVAAVAALWASASRPAAACDPPSPPSITGGLLGFGDLMPMTPISAELPRNVAFAFWPGHGEPQLMQDQSEVELEPLGPEPSPGHAGLATARTPLEPGRAYRYEGVAFTVQDFLDEEAPARPTLSGADLAVAEHESGCLGGSSCGDRTVVVRARPLAGPDNHTPTERLTYALYLGSTPEAAREAMEPARFGVLESGETWFFAADAWADRDVFISIATLDFAGNESERTDPIRIHSAPDGCHATGSPRLGSLAWIITALLVCSLRGRRRGKRASGAGERGHRARSPRLVRARSLVVACNEGRERHAGDAGQKPVSADIQACRLRRHGPIVGNRVRVHRRSPGDHVTPGGRCYLPTTATRTWARSRPRSRRRSVGRQLTR